MIEFSFTFRFAEVEKKVLEKIVNFWRFWPLLPKVPVKQVVKFTIYVSLTLKMHHTTL